MSPSALHRLTALPPIIYQGRENACGPFALAMAATSLLGREVTAEETIERLRLHRVPWLGATLPWGITIVARQLGLEARAQWLGQLADLTRLVDADHLAVVLVHPDDWPGMPWWALHYRLVVGYRDDPDLPGGGELYFACSGTPTTQLPGDKPGNVAVSFAQFRGQWHTYLTPMWYAELSRSH